MKLLISHGGNKFDLSLFLFEYRYKIYSYKMMRSIKSIDKECEIIDIKLDKKLNRCERDGHHRIIIIMCFGGEEVECKYSSQAGPDCKIDNTVGVWRIYPPAVSESLIGIREWCVLGGWDGTKKHLPKKKNEFPHLYKLSWKGGRNNPEKKRWYGDQITVEEVADVDNIAWTLYKNYKNMNSIIKYNV